MAERSADASSRARTDSGNAVPKPSGTRNRILIYGLVLLVVFLLGFAPQHLRVRELTQQVETLQWQQQVAAARDSVTLLLRDVWSSNFGIAAQRASQVFNQVRSMAERAPNSDERALLQDIAGRRDAVTAGLAKADPAVRADVERIFDELYTKIGPPR
jgi:hypothetical protein